MNGYKFYDPYFDPVIYRKECKWVKSKSNKQNVVDAL